MNLQILTWQSSERLISDKIYQNADIGRNIPMPGFETFFMLTQAKHENQSAHKH